MLPHCVEAVWLFASSTPDSVVDITTGFDRKLAARLAHISQTPNAAALAESWHARASQVGAASGLALAETFTVLHIG